MGQDKSSVIGLTGRDLILQRLPELQYDPSKELRTDGASISSTHRWEGVVLNWRTFGSEVAHETRHGQAPDHKILTWVDKKNPLWSLEQEHYVCGEEKGVEGRFNNNVMQVMAAAAKDHLLNVTCGDFKSTQESSAQRKDKEADRTYPDIVGMTAADLDTVPKNSLRFVGEVKADWTDDLYSSHAEAEDNEAKALMPWLRQIAKYMRKWELKYGFITTYISTIFVKYANLSKFTDEEDVILISNPVRWNHTEGVSGRRLDPTVSLRQAMWFLMKKSNEPDAWKYTKPDVLPEGLTVFYRPERSVREPSERLRKSTKQQDSSQARGGQSSSTGAQEQGRGQQNSGYPTSFSTMLTNAELLSLQRTPLCLDKRVSRKKKAPYFYIGSDDDRTYVDPRDVRYYSDLDLITLCRGGVDTVRLDVSENFMRKFMDSGLDIKTRMMDMISS